jgi:hypothetical protein
MCFRHIFCNFQLLLLKFLLHLLQIDEPIPQPIDLIFIVIFLSLFIAFVAWFLLPRLNAICDCLLLDNLLQEPRELFV